LALPTLELLVELLGTAIADRRRRAVARRVLEADRSPRRGVVGGARPPARLLRTAEEHPRQCADVGQDQHEDDPHRFREVAAQRRIGGDAVEQRPDPEEEQENSDKAVRFEHAHTPDGWRLPGMPEAYDWAVMRATAARALRLRRWGSRLTLKATSQRPTVR